MPERKFPVRAIAAFALCGALLVGARPAAAAPTAATKCRSTKTLAAANEAKCLGVLYRKSMIFGIPADPADVAKCASKLASSFTKAETSGGPACPTTGDGSTVETAVRACIDDATASLGGPTGTGLPTDICQSKKILAAALYAQCRSTVDAKALLKGAAPAYTKCVDKVTKAFVTLDTRSTCATTGDLGAIKDDLDACAEQIMADLTVEGAFRMTTINVLKPTFVPPGGGIGCNFPINANVNSQVQTYVNSDGNGDTYRDLSLLIVQSSNEQVGTIPGTAAAADCADADPTMCAFTPGGFEPDVTFTNRTFGSCTVDSFTIPAGSFGCFDTVPKDFPIDLGPLTLSLKSAQAGGQYNAKPATSITSGRMRGFLPKTTADSTIIDPATPLVGGQAVSAILRGTQCPGLNEIVTGPGGVPGWWVEIDYTAQKVTLP